MPGSGKTQIFNSDSLGLVYGSQMEPSSKIGYQQMSRSSGSMAFVSFGNQYETMVLNFACSWSWKNYTHVRILPHFATILFWSIGRADI
jgi:hypothetical protein